MHAGPQFRKQHYGGLRRTGGGGGTQKRKWGRAYEDAFLRRPPLLRLVLKTTQPEASGAGPRARCSPGAPVRFAEACADWSLPLCLEYEVGQRGPGSGAQEVSTCGYKVQHHQGPNPCFQIPYAVADLKREEFLKPGQCCRGFWFCCCGLVLFFSSFKL